jgi:hypothetical protein
MPGGGVIPITGTADVSRVEAPVTVRAYLIIAFAAFGGIFFGYDTGWMGGVLNMDYFIKQYTGAEYPDVKFPGQKPDSFDITAYRKATFSVSPRDTSLTTSILSAGTFFGKKPFYYILHTRRRSYLLCRISGHTERQRRRRTQIPSYARTTSETNTDDAPRRHHCWRHG